MMGSCKLWIVATILPSIVSGFTVRPSSSRTTTTKVHLMDPHQLMTTVVDNHHVMDESIHAAQNTYETLMSTLVAPAMKLTPAHEHVNPLFGPPDQYLQAGKSIAPMNPNAFQDAGLTVPKPLDQVDLPEDFQKIMMQNKRAVLDPNSITAFDNVMPGFKKSVDAGSSVSNRFSGVTPGDISQATMEEEMKYAIYNMHVIRKLPMAALLYVLTEFFLIKPVADMYAEDIEDDRVGVMTDQVSVYGMRAVSILAITVLTMQVTNILG
mmetsp:Transcript_24960/g.34913  ORF Transcript_24960/g.34913 Transcript_24960/m.34913 type:complete len:266 (+) Transcript_24960:198-995(+)